MDSLAESIQAARPSTRTTPKDASARMMKRMGTEMGEEFQRSGIR